MGLDSRRAENVTNPDGYPTPATAMVRYPKLLATLGWNDERVRSCGKRLDVSMHTNTSVRVPRARVMSAEEPVSQGRRARERNLQSGCGADLRNGVRDRRLDERAILTGAN